MKAWKVTHPNYEWPNYIHATTWIQARWRVFAGVKPLAQVDLDDIRVKRVRAFDHRPFTAEALQKLEKNTSYAGALCKCDVCQNPKESPQLKAWCVTHPDYNGGAYVHAETRSKARYRVWLQVMDVLPFKLIDLEVKREKRLDDKPITARSLLDIIGGTDVSPSCRCEMCLKEKERINEP